MCLIWHCFIVQFSLFSVFNVSHPAHPEMCQPFAAATSGFIHVIAVELRQCALSAGCQSLFPLGVVPCASHAGSPSVLLIGTLRCRSMNAMIHGFSLECCAWEICYSCFLYAAAYCLIITVSQCLCVMVSIIVLATKCQYTFVRVIYLRRLSLIVAITSFHHISLLRMLRRLSSVFKPSSSKCTWAVTACTAEIYPHIPCHKNNQVN